MKTPAEILIGAARPAWAPALMEAILGRPPLPGELHMSPEMARQWKAQAEFRMALRFALGGNAVARAEA